MIDYRLLVRVIGILLVIVGGMMWTGLVFSWWFASEDSMALLQAGCINVGVGIPMWFFTRKHKAKIRKREGYLIVTLGWLAMIFSGMLPYLLSGVIPSIPDALFETTSGMTTTGASILTNIEALPEGILYWRSLTQWIGGMGIIVLTIAVLPLLGIGGVELFVAEAPGPTSDKIHPRISGTAKRLWGIYVGLTAALCLILKFYSGMSFYDAINHALTTMATGGFSTKNASMMAFDTPEVQYPIMFFMLLAGTNYAVLYLIIKRRWRHIWANDEFKAYLFIIVSLAIFITIGVQQATGSDWERSFRDSTFQILSIITTTGFVSANYTAWGGSWELIFFILLFLGACAGSTSGGIKIIRHFVFFKNSVLEFKRILHPQAVIPLKLNGTVVSRRVSTHIIIFLVLYLIIFLTGSIVLTFMGIDFKTALGAVATSLANVGPGIGEVGPVDNFAWLPTEAKLFLAGIMLIGRLEIFTVLVLFTPHFWTNR